MSKLYNSMLGYNQNESLKFFMFFQEQFIFPGNSRGVPDMQIVSQSVMSDKKRKKRFYAGPSYKIGFQIVTKRTY